MSEQDLEPIIAKKQWEPLLDQMVAAIAEKEDFKAPCDVCDSALPFDDSCFRSVELAWAHPDDVISGEGTRLRGTFCHERNASGLCVLG